MAKLVVAFCNFVKEPTPSPPQKRKEIVKQLVRPFQCSVCSGYAGFEFGLNILTINMCFLQFHQKMALQ